MSTVNAPCVETSRATRQAPQRDWVPCPVCAEPDMRRETDDEGNSLIFCVNHNCLSNGGTNRAGIDAAAG